MGMTSFLIGGSFGFGGQVYSNYIRKVPLSRRKSIN